jgi:hypothetical protein
MMTEWARTCFLNSMSSLYSGMCFDRYIETMAFELLAGRAS